MFHNERDGQAYRQLQLWRLLGKIRTHVVGGLGQEVVMNSVWLMDSTLQFPGGCRHIYRQMPRKFPTIATSYRRVPEKGLSG